MSMPSFPKVDMDITHENAINMILTSIAMEELALSHIMNAEGEKLQYVLKHLESACDVSDNSFAVDKLLAVNASVANLLDSVSQNQMLLKGKMDKALNSLCGCPERHKPCKLKCNAIFDVKCVKWCHGKALQWNKLHQHGDCVFVSHDDLTAVEIHKKGQFLVNFSATVKNMADCKLEIAVSLQSKDKKVIFTAYDSLTESDAKHTVFMNGILIDTSTQDIPFPLYIRLVSAGQMIAEKALLNIVEI